MNRSIIILFFIVFIFISGTEHSKLENLNTAEKIHFEEPGTNYQLILQNEINTFVSSPELENAIVGFALSDLKENNIISEYNSSFSIVPASVQKLITTATALELLGPDTTFSTELCYSGFLNLKNKSLNGDIIIKGGGDPCLGSDAFKTNYPKEGFIDFWVNKIIELGIDTINGDIISDASVFDEEITPGGWAWLDIPAYYGCAPFGLCAYDNQFNLIFNTKRKGKYLVNKDSIKPYIPCFYFENKLTKNNKEDKYLDLLGAYYSNTRIIKGNLSEISGILEMKGSIPDPPYLIAYQLTEALKQKGIMIRGEAKTSRMLVSEKRQIPEISTVICRLMSPKLSDIIKRTNQYSINLFAEMLLCHIGYKVYHLGSTKAGIKALNNFWESKGIKIKGFFVGDGSGLARENAITARFLVNILSYMYLLSSNKEIFIATLPVSGVSGTMRTILNGTEAEGKISAKTGTMTRVKCFAGYIRAKSGKNYAFSLLINNFSCSSSILSSKIQRLLLDLYLNN